MLRVVLATTLLLFLGLAGTIEAQCTQQVIDPTTPGDGDEFGYSLDLRGNVLLVGARYVDDGSNQDAGLAQIFRFDGAGWPFEATVMDTLDIGNFEQFGWSVALATEDVAVVGAHFDNLQLQGGGAVWVFRFDGGGWPLEQKIVPLDNEFFDAFGSVGADGDVIVGGARLDDDLGNASGSAYVFRDQGGAWTEEAKLLASDGAGEDFFGFCTAVSGGVAVVGAPQDDDNGAESGSVYVFRFNGASWIEEQKLIASDGAAGDLFGCDLDVDGDVLVVGAVGDDDGGDSSGSAYVFRFDGATWVEEQKLLASNATEEDEFGFATAVEGDTLAVGNRGSDTGISGGGSVSIFRFNGTVWEQDPPLLADTPVENGRFGNSVALDADRLAVGSPDDQNLPPTPNPGRAIVVDCDGPPPTGSFVRGDTNDDATIDISDSIFLLSFLFTPGADPLPCEKSSDVNDDGGLDISDPIYLLTNLFSMGAPPPPPSPGCGPDPTPDSLSCAAFSSCP